MRRVAPALAWAILGLGLAAGPATAACSMTKLAELPITMRGLTPLVSVKIDRTDAKLIADSGAFFSMLTPQIAKRIGLVVNPAPAGLTVTGSTGAAEVGRTDAKDFTVLGVTLHNADFLVGAPQFDGFADGLLGENMLALADTEFDLPDGIIRLMEVKGCDKANLAYWTQTQYSVMGIRQITLHSDSIVGTVKVNGVAIRAKFDTGAWRTVLSRRGAKAAGVSLDGPGVTSGGLSGGVGRRVVQTWIAPVASFAIGDNEEVKNTRLRVGDMDLDDVDMLIGADFFLSHRILVSKSQSKLYLSYIGGPVFNLDAAGEAGAAPSAAAAAGTETPNDADGYARRADAFAARNEYDKALADFSRAAELDPGNPRRLIDRGRAYRRAGKPDLALADFDAALKLRPDDPVALMARARLLQSRGDDKGASADIDAAVRRDPAERRAAAETYLDAKRFPEAVAQLDAWIATGPPPDDMAKALSARCWTRALWGRDLDKAEADCDASLRLAPDDVGALNGRGLVRTRAGEFDKAIADYNAALRAKPGDAWSRYGRGLAELRKGATAAGQADIAAAETAEPTLAAQAKRLGVTP